MGAVLFVTDELLLKASHYQSKWINGYNRGGTWIHAHQKNVLVSDDHDDEKVASGQGSFYQKQAHKQAHAEVEGFADWPVDHKVAIVLSHATTLQKEASASAAVSGFKASMMAGKAPTPAQYLAMQNASTKVQGDVADACAAHIGEDTYTKLLWQASAKAAQVSQPQEKTLAQAKETTETVPHSAQQQTPPGVADPAKPAAVGVAAAEAEAAVPAKVVVTTKLPAHLQASVDKYNAKLAATKSAVSAHTVIDVTPPGYGPDPAPSGKTATIGGIGFVAVKKQSPNGGYWIPQVGATGQEIDHQSYPTKDAMWADLEKVAKIKGDKFAWNMGIEEPAAVPANPAEITVPAANGKTGPTTFKPAPDFANYDEAMVWTASRAMALGMSKADFKSSHEYANAFPKINAAYAVVKQQYDDKKAKTGADMLAQMNAAGVKLGDTVAFTMTGAFLSANHYEGKVVMHDGIPHVKLAHEVSVSNPGGKIGYTKFLPWAPYMKPKAAVVVIKPERQEPDPQVLGEASFYDQPATVTLGDHLADPMITGLSVEDMKYKWLKYNPGKEAEWAAAEVKHDVVDPDAPKEGDTKVENGKTYKLFGGKWHRTDENGWTMTAKRMGMEAKKVGVSGNPASDPDFVAVFGSDMSSNKTIQAMSDYHKGWDLQFDAEAAAAKSATPDPVDDSANHKAAVAAMETGAFYQKEAIKKLKAEHGAAWDAMHPSKQHELAHAKYQALQGAASQAAAVSGWKKHMLAGQVPSPSEVKAFSSWALNNPDKTDKLISEVQSAIGADKMGVLVAQSHAKAAKAPASVPAPSNAKVFVTKPIPGNMTFEPVKPSNAHATGAAAILLSSKPAYDHLAQYLNMAGTEYAKKTQLVLGAQDWLAANPDKEQEMHEALAALHIKQSIIDKIGMLTKPGENPVAPAANVAKDKFKDNPPVHDFILAFKLHGGSAVGNKSIDDLLAPDEIAAFNALPNHQKVDVAAAISFYGPHKLQLFTNWLSLQSNKAPVGPFPVPSDVYKNTTAGHKKFWSVSVHGNVMKTTYGKIGTMGSTTTKEYPNPGAAVVAMAHLKQQKVVKGYKHSGKGEHDYDGVAVQSAPAAVDPGPQDGDTKQGADGTLVFRGGRWHKQGSPLDSVVIPDFTSLTAGKWGPIYNKVADELKSAVEYGGLASLKKHVIYHEDGRISVHATGAKLNKLGQVEPQYNGAQKKRREAMFKLVMDLKDAAEKMPKGKKAVFTTAAPVASKPAPTQAAKVFVQPMAKPTTVKTSDGKLSVTVIDSWAQTGKQKGSNPGGTFKDKAGQEWYCKFPASEDHCKNELLASKLYQAAGVDCPTLRLVKRDGKIGIASKIVHGVQMVGAGMKSVPGALEGFAVDAWLGNYDSVGTGHDNLLKTSDGKAIRIDVGGSLLYRAQGVPKGDAFGNDAVEIDGMRDPATNSYAASVFSGMSKSVLNESVALVLDMPNDVIQEIVGKYGPGSEAQKKALADKLIARKNSLAKKYPEADLIANPPKPDPRHLTIQKALLPKQLDFANWKGVGQGLSGTASINEVNQKAVDEVYAAAMKGDYVALKKLKYHIVDKTTGKLTEGALFGDHPSQHVKDFYSKVIDYMEVVANPAAKKAKAWLVNDYSDIDELSDAFKAHFYGVSVGVVPANQRLGFWISLGQADAAMSFMPGKVEYTSAADSAKGVQSTKSLPGNLTKWMKAVKGSGSANQPYRDGKEVDNQGQSTRDVLTEAYKHSVEFSEGTRITKNIDFPPAMLQQMLGLPEGHVFQNPGSMCCSLNKNWSGFSGNARLKIVYANGAKALYNIGVGSFSGEGEITTIPGQRFMLLEKTPNGHPPEFTLLMLPPDDTYVANIKPKG